MVIRNCTKPPWVSGRSCELRSKIKYPVLINNCFVVSFFWGKTSNNCLENSQFFHETQWFFEVFEINVTGSSLILDFFSNRVEQLVSEHLRVRRANASQMLLHCSKSSSCRAKSYTSKGAWIIKKSSRNEQVIHILVLGGQKHTKKIFHHLRTHEHHPAHAWGNAQWSMTKHYLPSSQILDSH